MSALQTLIKNVCGWRPRDICWAYLDRFSGMAKSSPGRGGGGDGGVPTSAPEFKTLEGSPPALSGSLRRLPHCFSSSLLRVLWAMVSLETQQGCVGGGGRDEKGFLAQRNSCFTTDPCPPLLPSQDILWESCPSIWKTPFSLPTHLLPLPGWVQASTL